MDKKIIIIGTGVFGCSTVNHVTKRWPSAEIHVISRPSPNAPSDDISKIVRTDYTDEKRMNEAIAASVEWDSNDNLKAYQRTTGRVVIYDTSEIDTFHRINSIRERLGRPAREKKGAELMKQHFGANIETEGRIFTYNSDDRIVDWKPCMDEQRKNARAACESSGGGFYETGVKALDHQNKSITNIRLEDGRTIKAEDAEVILAAGPWVLQIMDQSVIPRPPLNRRPVPTGSFSFHLLMTDLQVELLGKEPALSYGRYADWVPPASGSNTGKITWTETFTTTGHVIKDMSRTDLTTTVLKKVRDFVRVNIPPLRGAKIKAAVNQWDAVTPTQDPLIDKHPDFINLTVATGGSFNRAKDLPTIGSHILDAVENKNVPAPYRWRTEKPSLHQIHPHLASKFNVDEVKYSQEDEDLGEI